MIHALFALTLLAGLGQRSTADKPSKPPAVSVDELPIGAIPPQTLPAGTCAAFLWSQTPSHALIAMLVADPARLRFAPGGALTDLVRVGQSGAAQFGFAATTEYGGGDYRVTVDMDIATRGDLTNGAAIPSATFQVDQAGHDTIIVPAGGIIGCS